VPAPPSRCWRRFHEDPLRPRPRSAAPILAACKADDGSTNTTAAPAEPAAAPATTEPAAPAAGSEGAAPAAAEGEGPADAARPPHRPRPPPLTGPAPVEGADYQVIPNGQPFQPAAGKIEVTEIFGYVCPACAAFQPLVGPWKAGLPSDVNFVYVPAMFGGTWDDYARAFYAAQTLGVQEKTHEALYAAIHSQKTLKGERGPIRWKTSPSSTVPTAWIRSSSPPPWAASR
jgi:thiol:disulfide interchange protein DsbA